MIDRAVNVPLDERDRASIEADVRRKLIEAVPAASRIHFQDRVQKLVAAVRDQEHGIGTNYEVMVLAYWLYEAGDQFLRLREARS